MDDLLGEDWQKPSKPATSTIPPMTASFNAPRSQTQTPLSIPTTAQSGRSTPQPISRPSSILNSNGAPKGDQFGALLGLKSGKAATANVSIQERQRQLLEERRRQQDQQSHMWDSLGSGSASGRASGTGTPDVVNSGSKTDEEEDIFAAFSKDAPVDKASHFPPPAAQNGSAETSGGFDDDDDPFGLGALPKVANGQRTTQSVPMSDDDVLGDLGKPVESRPPVRETAPKPSPRPREPSPDNTAEDGAVAELVDMGFPLDNAKIALAESGGDVQSAVGWLLRQAHEESKQKARQEEPDQRHRSAEPRSREDGSAVPQWARQNDRSSSGVRRQDSRSPANGEKDAAAVAQELGNKLFKGASSLWKVGQKQVAKTVADFQGGGSGGGEASSQPKWMQETSTDSSRSTSQRREPKLRKPEIDVTDEAAMLDMPRDRPTKPARSGTPPTSELPSRPAERQSQPRFMQQQPPLQDKRPATKLSRQEVEEQSAQAYISPARRKRPTPSPTPAAEVDLFSSGPAAPAVQQPQSSKPLPAAAISRSAQVSRPSPSPRPQAPPRTIPQVSSTALKTSASHRTSGTEAFKRGDYASAHASYTSALTGIPQQHPIAIVILCNRALTALKTGDPKAAVLDAERALGVIGPGNGTGETVEDKPMKEFWGKAVMRKAEGLEALEKWSEAAQAWRIAVEAGVGGAISARGRDRSEKAGAPKPKAAPVAKPAAAKPKPKPVNKGPGPGEAAAVASLRAANAAAAQEEDARFAATDAVDARLAAWKSGKSDNLRALLQSLDQVLWEGAGWKKVGMADLILPGKVKIIYMKAIGRVHPDKVSLRTHTSR